jgi:hypothetical protein
MKDVHKILIEEINGRDRCEGLGLDGRIILKGFLNAYDSGQ